MNNRDLTGQEITSDDQRLLVAASWAIHGVMVGSDATSNVPAEPAVLMDLEGVIAGTDTPVAVRVLLVKPVAVEVLKGIHKSLHLLDNIQNNQET